MMANEKKTLPSKKRGRPKTLDREHVVRTSMFLYWREGLNGVSINEICKRAEVSKPSLYREFGNDDGLMKAVLLYYKKNVIDQVFKILDEDKSFNETLDQLVAMVSQQVKDLPKGCLFVKMRASRLTVGDETRQQIDDVQKDLLFKYKKWVKQSQEKGEVSKDLDPSFAANYLNAQIGNAESLKARGEKPKIVKEVLEASVSILKK